MIDGRMVVELSERFGDILMRGEGGGTKRTTKPV
jgi:hypothetical protein